MGVKISQLKEATTLNSTDNFIIERAETSTYKVSVGTVKTTVNTSPTITNPTISGGTIDNTVIGGTTPSTGRFTSVVTSVIRPASDSTDAVQIQTSGGSHVLDIDTVNRYVGVGTVTPDSKLHVEGEAGGTELKLLTLRNKTTAGANTGVAIRLSSGSTSVITYAEIAGIIVNTSDGGNGRLVFRTRFNGNVTEHVTIAHNGNVGIGVGSPSYQLHLSQDSAAKPSSEHWTVLSDIRLKKEIQPADLDRCYEIVKQIPLKYFRWKDEVYTEEQAKDRGKLGFIADDVEPFFPKAVTIQEKFELASEHEEEVEEQRQVLDEQGNPVLDENGNPVMETVVVKKMVKDTIENVKGLNSDQIYAALFGAVQKLISKVEKLEAEIAMLKGEQ